MANNFTANASLPKPIDDSQIFQDMDNLQQAHNSAMDLIERSVCGLATSANSQTVNTGGCRVVTLQYATMGSIATIIGALVGMPFTLLCQSGASWGIVDTGAFKLASSLILTDQDTITLVWDGTNYFETGRSVN